MKKIKDKVEYILSKYPEARNSDAELTKLFWGTFHKDIIIPVKVNGELVKGIALRNLKRVVSQSTIIRWRAHIQNTRKMYIPTEWKVAKRRGIAENDWKRILGYNVQPSSQYSLPV